MKTILFVFGTRPEAIKMAPILQLISHKNPNFKTKVCVTAQHREMLDQILDLFQITPDFDLDIMKEKQELIGLSAKILVGMRDIYASLSPDAVIVHGDTTTALISAQAAFFSGIPVGHVEAGLRTYDLQAPFPEEFNRQIISKFANWHFAPTLNSKNNLLSEGIKEEKIYVTGNTVIDALLEIRSKINQNEEWTKKLSTQLEGLCKKEIFNKKYILITGHRRENFGEGFFEICHAIARLSKKFKDINFVYPVHLNPKVQKPVNELLVSLNNVILIPPQDYDSFIFLLDRCFAVLTDSGGIQEEAPSLGKPVLVMREKTERPEALNAGTVKLVGANKDRIYKGVEELLNDENLYKKMSEAHNPYGNGKASKKILKILMKDME
jgi:UDP-N-acetylglucosamine 2-epimerase (non-hydrolysing)|tara:strand:- start:2003 stop:3145 length:1143 start_codon:yes stop_codon:yes gene_type:complete